MARRVGKLHKHDLPNETKVEWGEVYRCNCNREFFRGKTDGTNLPCWISLDNSAHYVEYGEEELDAPLIGKYTPEVPGVPRTPAQEPTEESSE